ESLLRTARDVGEKLAEDLGGVFRLCLEAQDRVSDGALESQPVAVEKNVGLWRILHGGRLVGAQEQGLIVEDEAALALLLAAPARRQRVRARRFDHVGRGPLHALA